MADGGDGGGSLLKSLSSLAFYFSAIDSLVIVLGVFLIVFDTVKSDHRNSLFGVRLILLGFGMRAVIMTESWKGRRFWGLFLIAMAILPRVVFLCIYAYAK
jgi:predicted membrane chloride channel (bestrophin family)